MASDDVQVELIAGLPSVRFESPPTDSVLAAMNALIEAFGAEAVVDGDHESMAFDPGWVTVEDIRRVLGTLGA